MTNQRTEALNLALAHRPVPLDVDVDTVAGFIHPRTEGQTSAAHTAALLAASHADNPDRREQCALGNHGRCTDPDGTDGCGCACHPLLDALREDHPYLDTLANLFRKWTWHRATHYHGWYLASQLLALGFTLHDAADPVAEPTDHDADRLAVSLWGEHAGESEHGYAAGLLEDLTELGLLRRQS